MLKEESLHFWVAKSKMSHEKLFLLSNSNTGDTRVIFGSANFSFQAFSNLQRELICYCDNDEKAFNYFKTEFNILFINPIRNLKFITAKAIMHIA